MLTVTISLANHPTVIWSQDITSTVFKSPDTPLAPTTSLYLNTGVTIAWTAPSDGGKAIIAYNVKIKTSNGSFSDLVECSGSIPAIVSAHSCTILITTLRAVPFAITSGASIYATVVATNELGSSDVSLAGNGAVMTLDCSSSSMSVSVALPSSDVGYTPEK